MRSSSQALSRSKAITNKEVLRLTWGVAGMTTSRSRALMIVEALADVGRAQGGVEQAKAVPRVKIWRQVDELRVSGASCPDRADRLPGAALVASLSVEAVWL